MKKLITIIATTALTLFNSCTNSIEDIDINNVNTEIGSFSFIYKGVTYTSEYKATNNSIGAYTNTQVAELMNKFIMNKNMATLVHPNGEIELFDNEAEMNNSIFLKKNRAAMIGPLYNCQITSVTIDLYEDTGFKGKHPQFIIKDGQNYSIPDFRNIGFNDKMSAFKLSCTHTGTPSSGTGFEDVSPKNICKITYYQDTDFQGYSLTYLVYPEKNTIEEGKLKNVKPFGPYWDRSWNDETSSFKLEMVVQAIEN